MSVVDQHTFGWYERPRDARAYHESQSNVEDALRCLRKHELAKVGWENRNPGARLAPAIEVLRNGYGFEIAGNGSVKKPYRLIDPKQWPTKVRTTDEIEDAYYASPHWQSVRNQRWSHDGYQCVLCIGRNDEPIQCHHIIYNLFAESLDELMTVCEWHHKLIHENSRIGFPIGVPLAIADRLIGYHELEEWLKP